MVRPQPRSTVIVESKNVPGLFYEGFYNQPLNNSGLPLVVAIHYKSVRFDLGEIVRIKGSEEFELPNFVEVEGEILGTIVGIEPQNESKDSNLVLRIDDCESEESNLFSVTEIEKE